MKKRGVVPGFVYFMRCGPDGPIKIGWAKDPLARRRDLQGHNHAELALLGMRPGTMADERWLHRCFAKSRLRGEWFEPTEELLTIVAKATSSLTKPLPPDRFRAFSKEMSLLSANEEHAWMGLLLP